MKLVSLMVYIGDSSIQDNFSKISNLGAIGGSVKGNVMLVKLGIFFGK